MRIENVYSGLSFLNLPEEERVLNLPLKKIIKIR